MWRISVSDQNVTFIFCRYDIYSWGEQDVHWQSSQLWKNGTCSIITLTTVLLFCGCFFFQMKFASLLIKEKIFIYPAMFKGELHIKEFQNPWSKLAASLLCQLFCEVEWYLCRGSQQWQLFCLCLVLGCLLLKCRTLWSDSCGVVLL